MRVVATGDWHGEFPEELDVGLPDGDVLVIAGDVMPVWNHDRRFQAGWFREHFVPRLATMAERYELVAFVGGNHDFVLQDSRRLTADLPGRVAYLQDSAVEHGGAVFYGTPWCRTFGRWAFMDDEDGLATRYAAMPDAVDVLISHGPPYGLCDRVDSGDHVGSISLLEAIASRAPRHVVTGHIHEAYGSAAAGSTAVSNVSLMDVRYRPVNPAAVLEL